MTDLADHCESPAEAFEDIQVLLRAIAKQLGRDAASLKIYDPYYCHGGTERKLKRLGFSTVYNKNEDFYAAIDAQTVPDFDVLVTNPPVTLPVLLSRCRLQP